MRAPSLSAFLVALAALAFAPAAALAESGRVDSTPNGWWHLYGATDTQISNVINNEGARLLDLEVASTSPLRFNATFVHNSGPHAVGAWWWYFGVTAADVGNFLTANSARLIDLRRYDDNGQTRFTCVMVRNTGAQNKAWWWLVGATATDVGNLAANNSARLVSLASFDNGGSRRFDAVFISNTGGDAKAWWWYHGVTSSTVINNLNANQARLYDWNIYTDAGQRRFDVIMVGNTGGSAINWWWYFDTSVSNIVAQAAQNGARVFDIESYTPSVTTLYGALMMNNSNALTTRVAGILGYGSDGATGLYLKRTNGGVLASLHENFVFEPASTIKGLIALHFMRQVQGGGETMGASHSQFTAMTGSCPLDATPVNESFRRSLHRMLKNSDNSRTQFFRQRYGNEDINATGMTAGGMTASLLRHRIGCADSANAAPNRLTLADNAGMYERIFKAQALTGAWRDSLRQYLVNESDNFPIQVQLEAIVDQEAANMGMGIIAQDYKDAILYGFKAGSYGLCFPTCEYFYSVGGWVQLPFCQGRVPGEEYVFGTFVHGASTDAGAGDRMWEASAEIFRDEVRAGLQAWWNTCVVDVDEPGPLAAVRLSAPAPNPTSGGVTVRYALPRASAVRLTVHDLAGREVAVLAQSVQAPGERSVSWDSRDDAGRRLSSGLYFIRLQAAGETHTRKLVLRP